MCACFGSPFLPSALPLRRPACTSWATTNGITIDLRAVMAMKSDERAPFKRALKHNSLQKPRSWFRLQVL